jgi:hypothetical protein
VTVTALHAAPGREHDEAAAVRLLLLLLAVTGHGLPRRCASPDCRKRLRRLPGQDRYEGARGLCGACYHRAWRAGFPAQVPAALSTPAASAAVASAAACRAAMSARMAVYAGARDCGSGPHAAAARAGVRGHGTVRKYERAYQAARHQREEQETAA